MTSHRSAADARFPFEERTLDNGLQVIVHPDDTVPLVATHLMYHVGSRNEPPGRRGFAHLFEHLLFQGSENIPEGEHFRRIQAAGGTLNGTTWFDRTNYYETLPSGDLDLAMWLESDRMGFFLPAITQAKLDNQRDVVKNERRQSYENRPYGQATILLEENLYPSDHPYHWPTIGYMEDLSAASYQDVVDFFKSYYGPNNASLVVAGDIDIEETKKLVAKWFSDVPGGPPVPPFEAPTPVLNEEKRIVLEDRVQLPRLYMAWLSPAGLSAGDAEMDVLSSILTYGKNSRLFKRLVYDLQIAQNVFSFQNSGRLGSSFLIVATARSGVSLARLEEVIMEEVGRIIQDGPETREVERAVNQAEANFLRRLERVGSFGGKADQLNRYYFYTGNPDFFNEDLSRYKALDLTDIQAVAQHYLGSPGRVVLSVVPEGKTELAAENSEVHNEK